MQDANGNDNGVDTSDAEESENLQAAGKDYWSIHLPHIRTTYSSLDNLDKRTVQLTPDRSRIISTTTPYRVHDDGYRPRKRLKVDMTPSSSTILDEEVVLDSPPLFSSQTTLYYDSTRQSPRLEGAGKGPPSITSLPPTSSLVRADSHDPLDHLLLTPGSVQSHSNPQSASSVVIQDARLADDARWIPPGSSPDAIPSPTTENSQPNPLDEENVLGTINPHTPTTPVPLSPLSSVSSSGQTPSLPTRGVESPQPLVNENNTAGRWSFRSRNIHQMHPYLYERLQYKHQMRGIPDAVVNFRSPECRRRSSTGAEMSQDFLEDDGDVPENLETLRYNPLSATDRQSRGDPNSRRTHSHRLRVSSQEAGGSDNIHRARHEIPTSRSVSRPSGTQPSDERMNTRESPISPQRKWYPTFLQDLSASDSSDDDRPLDLKQNAIQVDHERHTGMTTSTAFSAEESDNNKADSSDSPLVLSPIRRRRKHLKPKPPPWMRHKVMSRFSLDNDGDDIPNAHDAESNSVIEVDGHINSDSPNSHSETGDPLDDESLPSPVDKSDSSDIDEGLSLKDRKNLQALRRMMPAGMVQKQLQISQKPRRRSTSTPSMDRASSPSQLLPGQSKIRVVSDLNLRDKASIIGDSESSDAAESVIEISSSEHSISDVEELRTQMYPGVLDIPLLSASEDEETDAELEVVNDADIDAWLQRRAHRLKTSKHSLEAREGDLIDRMLSRTRVTGTSSKNRTKVVRRHGRGHGRLRHKGIQLYIGGARSHKKARQLRLPDLFAKSHERDGETYNPDSNRSGHSSKQNSRTVQESAPIQSKVKHKKSHVPSLIVLPTRGLVTSGRRHKEGMTIDVEDTTNSIQLESFHPHFGQGDQSLAGQPYSIVESNDYRATHPTEFCLLPLGVSFGADTYIGKGWLEELVVVLRDCKTMAPKPYSADGVELTLIMDIDEFSQVLQVVFDHLLQDITNTSTYNKDKYNKWQETLHAVCQFLTWMSAGTYELVVPLRDLAKDQAQRLMQYLDGRLNSSNSALDVSFLLSFYWVAFEVSLRSCSTPQEGAIILSDPATALTRHLLRHSYAKPAITIFPDAGTISDLTPLQRISQIWISLFHVADGLADWFNSEPAGSASRGHVVWKLVQNGFEKQQLSDLEASEQLWSAIFNICALSQFSILGTTIATPRTLTSWDIVSLALRRIRLPADPVMDQSLPRRRLVKRDRYIRLLISRCFFLRTRWLWSLKDASVVFNHLVEVFKSRKFANLNGESSDFPSFMRHNDVSILSEYRNSDTAFGLFLKLAAQSIEDVKQDLDPGLSLKLRKLVSMLIPVGSVAFDKNGPPSAQELSMLYNRLSAIAVAIYLDPSPINVQNRLNQARRYIAFNAADLSTRRTCIRGMMYFAMIMQRLRLSLTAILEWMTEITNILIDEYQALGGNADSRNDPRNRVIITLQMLLGSLRHILESGQKLDGKSYPDPAFLEGPWITRVFSNNTDIANLSTTGLELQRLVQTFLDSRSAIIPKPRRPQIHDVSEDSQETQGYFSHMDIDLNDPELLAVLAEATESPEIKEMQVKDKLVSEIIDKHVASGIYRLVIKHVSDAAEESVQEDSYADIDTWVDCWVGCAQVVVYNGKRDWSFYLALGSQSWERIIDGSWRRRVGLRFMYMFLRLDPSSYPSHRDRFIDVLLESLVSSTVTMEHEYVSLLFSVDGLQHLLLHGIVCERKADGDYSLTQDGFKQSRVDILSTIFRNLSDSLQKEIHQPDLRSVNQTCLEHLVKMFSAMQDIYQSIECTPPQSGHSHSHRKEEYGAFCSRIVRQMRESEASLYSHERLRRPLGLLMTFGGTN